MRKYVIRFFVLILLVFSFLAIGNFLSEGKLISGAPPYGEPEKSVPGINSLLWFSDWVRPEGPAKVALQVGHWKNDELPDELEKLKGNTGSSGSGKSEWEVNQVVTQMAAEILNEAGVEVEILPATVPPSYWADVFVAIHADGNTDTSKRGFKVASPWRDYTSKARELVSILETSYEDATGWEKDPNISRNMRGYYAFSWWRYEHAIHPMTTAGIIETGFLTNRQDSKVLIENPEIPAQAIADGILTYLDREGLLAK